MRRRPAGQAVEIATTHAASLEHLLNEFDDALFALQMEGIREQRGY